MSSIRRPRRFVRERACIKRMGRWLHSSIRPRRSRSPTTTYIDSTFDTPIKCRPAKYVIDLVLHSGTKYLAGHGDLICGVAAGRRELIDQIHKVRTTLGCSMDPHAAFLLLRGIKTLAVRVQ